MKRSLDWRRHRLLAASLAAAAGLLALEVRGAFAVAALLALWVLLAGRFGRLRSPRPAQEVRLRVPTDFEYGHAFDDVFRQRTAEVDLVDVHAPGSCVDLQYAVRLRAGHSAEGLLGSLERLVPGSGPGPAER